MVAVSCSICLDDTVSTEIEVLCCKARFHFNCLAKWNSNCPACRFEFRKNDTIVREEDCEIDSEEEEEEDSEDEAFYLAAENSWISEIAMRYSADAERNPTWLNELRCPFEWCSMVFENQLFLQLHLLETGGHHGMFCPSAGCFGVFFNSTAEKMLHEVQVHDGNVVPHSDQEEDVDQYRYFQPCDCEHCQEVDEEEEFEFDNDCECGLCEVCMEEMIFNFGRADSGSSSRIRHLPTLTHQFMTRNNLGGEDDDYDESDDDDYDESDDDDDEDDDTSSNEESSCTEDESQDEMYECGDQGDIDFSVYHGLRKPKWLLNKQCPDSSCQRTFVSPNDLEKHLKMTSAHKVWTCCQRVFTHEHAFIQHCDDKH